MELLWEWTVFAFELTEYIVVETVDLGLRVTGFRCS